MFTISKMAALAGVSTDTLRYYEKEGLLAPDSKTEAGYRLYDAAMVGRIHFIKDAQQCGFSLSDIRELLTLKSRDSACCDDVRRLAIEKKLQLSAKIATMQRMSRALDQLLAKCTQGSLPLDDCPILAALEDGFSELR
jgi:MerR family Zn(II)-responsive transcriptional regulator of zntA